MTLAVKRTINNEQIWTEIFHTNASSVDGVVVIATITPVKIKWLWEIMMESCLVI